MNRHSRAQSPNPAPEKGMGKHTASPGTILVVEDERIVARDLQQRLKKLGFAVPEVASSGEEALRIAELLRPQLILMDIKLRGKVDGLEAARQIGERLKIPVIFLSAYDDEETRSASRLLNAIDYLDKPFEDQRLYTAISDFFSRATGTRKP
jgi:DNA-binding response OmpR family regulator